MSTVLLTLWKEEAGFVVSSELVLVSTITVLAMIAGLAELSYGVTQELEDTGAAFAAVNQSHYFLGLCGHAGGVSGSFFVDTIDYCDRPGDVMGCQPQSEGGNGNNYNGNW